MSTTIEYSNGTLSRTVQPKQNPLKRKLTNGYPKSKVSKNDAHQQFCNH
jgi:hypothetical protein